MHQTGFAVTTLDDVYLLEALGRTTPDALLWLQSEVTAFAEARPGRAVYVHCVGAGVKSEMPDERTRAAMLAFMRGASRHFAAAVLVMEAPGFAGAAVRSLFSGLFLLARLQLPLKTVGGTAAALHWLAQVSPSSKLPAAATVEAGRRSLAR